MAGRGQSKASVERQRGLLPGIPDEPKKSEQALAEFFRTPPRSTRALLNAKILPTDATWLEPMAGDGAIIREASEVREWWAIEKRQEEERGLCRLLRDNKQAPEFRDGKLRQLTADFFSDLAGDWIDEVEPDVICGNPANSIAFEVAKRSRELCPNSWLALYQPIAFGATLDRYEWLRDNCPDQYRTAERPDFIGTGGMSEYAWWVWPPVYLRGEYYWEESINTSGGWSWDDAKKAPVRRIGRFQILPPPGWSPSTQEVLL